MQYFAVGIILRESSFPPCVSPVPSSLRPFLLPPFLPITFPFFHCVFPARGHIEVKWTWHGIKTHTHRKVHTETFCQTDKPIHASWLKCWWKVLYCVQWVWTPNLHLRIEYVEVGWRANRADRQAEWYREVWRWEREFYIPFVAGCSAARTCRVGSRFVCVVFLTGDWHRRHELRRS